MKLIKFNKSGASIMEYAIVIGIASLAITGMNTYIKRGIQGRVKEMTDCFISSEQVVEVDPTISQTTTVSGAAANSGMLVSGGTKLESSESREIASESSVKDRDSVYSTPFIPAEEGEITPAQPAEEVSNPNFDWENETNIQALEAERQRLYTQAEISDAKVESMKEAGMEIISKARSIDCDGKKKCKRARNNAVQEGYKLIQEAEQIQNDNAQLRGTAGLIQERINNLNEGVQGG